MPSTVEARAKQGKFLIYIAWFIEISAAVVGLAFAWFTLLQRKGQIETSGLTITASDQMMIFVAAVPFVIVAMVELTKIPLASAVYFATSRLSRYIFAFCLLLLSIITFETFINGFLQGIQVRLAVMKEVQISQTKTEGEIKSLTDEKVLLTGLTRQQIDRTYAEKKMELTRSSQQEIENLTSIMDGERQRLGGPAVQLLTEEIDQLRGDQKDAKSRHEQNIKDIESRYEQQLNAVSSDTNSVKINLNDRIVSEQKEINALSKKIETKEQQIIVLRGRSVIGSKEEKIIQSRHQNDRKNISNRIENQKEVLNQRSSDIRNQLKIAITTRINNLFPSPQLDQKITDYETELETISKKKMDLTIQVQSNQIDDEENNAIEKIRSKLGSDISNRIDVLKEEIGNIERQVVEHKTRKENLASQLTTTTQGNKRVDSFNQKTREIEKSHEQYNDEKKRQSLELNAKIDDLERIVKFNQSELDPQVESYNVEIRNIRAKTIEAVETEGAIKRKNLADLTRRDYRLDEINKSILRLNRKYSEQEAKVMAAGRKTQIGQWSILFFNDMHPNHVRLVSMVWFGSLAAITALMGTLLAFASYTLRFGHEKRTKSSGLSRAFERFFIYLRKNIRKPRIKEITKEVEKIVEVTKEVPVEKVVIKEVPKEVIRKEVIHVPIATDDLTILDIDKNHSDKSSKIKKDSDEIR
jgi:hypothetical protein